VPPDQDPQNPPEGDPSPDPNAVTITVPQAEPPPAPPRPPRGGEPPQVFSPEDVERIRNEERDRYQAQLTRADQLENELAQVRKAEEERQAVAAKAERDRERAAKKKEEEEMDLRQVMERRDQEWEQKLAEERAEREKALAILDQERRYASLQNYLSQRVMEQGDKIPPQLRRFVAGNTPEEIDASIAAVIEAADQIADENSQLIAGLNSQRRTVGVTAPPMGPTDVAATSRSYTADELRDMSMEEYGRKEVREQLLSEAGRAYRNR
jgi:hypothetical protein